MRWGERPGWYVRVTLPEPWGRVGPWQTGMTTGRQAERVERWLREQARENPAVIDWIIRHGRNGLQAAWVANLRGTLDQLLAGAADPSLADAVEAYKAVCKDERAKTGLALLLKLAPVGARLSWLTDITIPQLYRTAQKTRKANSVRRSLHRAVTELLAYHLGAKRRDDILHGVRAPYEDDTREVSLTPGQLQKLLAAAPEERFRWMVLLAVHTTADRRPLLALEPRHWDDAEGTLTIPDRKTNARWRVLRVSPDAATVIRLATAGLSEHARLFPWTPGQVRKLWEATRDGAKLPALRFKDLRHVMPTILNAMGVPEAEIAKMLGHARGSRITGRYITPVGDPATLAEASAKLGLSGAHMRAG